MDATQKEFERLADAEMAGQLNLFARPPLEIREKLSLMSEAELAGAFKVEESTLASWRASNDAPVFVKLGKAVFYRVADVLDWLGAKRVTAPWRAPVPS